MTQRQEEPRPTRLDRLDHRLERVEQQLDGLSEEVRTRQLVVVDDQDHPRIVGEVFGDVAELRLELAGGDSEQGPELLLFAIARSHPRSGGLGPAIGLQLRAEGGAVFEVHAWPDADGTWRPHLHAGGL